MTSTSSKLKNLYMDWLKNELIFTDVANDYVSISTPFLDTNYDNIELFAKFITKNKIEITDFGYTLYNLEEAGLKVSKRSKTVYRIFEQILTDFGVSFSNNNALTITVDSKRFAIAKNRLLQAIMRINDLLYLEKNNIKSSFNEMISDFFIAKNIPFIPDLEIAGYNGTSSHFDFSLPLPAGNERLIKTVARPNDINQAKIFNFDVRETSHVRQATFSLVLNNVEKDIIEQIKINALAGLTAEKTTVLGFKEIEKNPELLSA